MAASTACPVSAAPTIMRASRGGTGKTAQAAADISQRAAIIERTERRQLTARRSQRARGRRIEPRERQRIGDTPRRAIEQQARSGRRP